MGRRIGDMRIGNRPIEAGKTYKVARWAPVADLTGDDSAGEPIWNVLSRYLRDRKAVKPRKLNLPRLIGVSGNRGIG
jgi:sulfur-oxidizing protein SoxB